jgi:hypothetical protein
MQLVLSLYQDKVDTAVEHFEKGRCRRLFTPVWAVTEHDMRADELAAAPLIYADSPASAAALFDSCLRSPPPPTLLALALTIVSDSFVSGAGTRCAVRLQTLAANVATYIALVFREVRSPPVSSCYAAGAVPPALMRHRSSAAQLAVASHCEFRAFAESAQERLYAAYVSEQGSVGNDPALQLVRTLRATRSNGILTKYMEELNRKEIDAALQQSVDRLRGLSPAHRTLIPEAAQVAIDRIYASAKAHGIKTFNETQ